MQPKKIINSIHLPGTAKLSLDATSHLSSISLVHFHARNLIYEMWCVRGAQQLENMKNDNNHQNCAARNTKRMCNKQAAQPYVRLTRREKENFKVDEKNNK